MKLNEIFDTEIKNLHWQSHGRYLLAGIKIDKIFFTIQIERKPLLIFDNSIKVKSAEVSFFRTYEQDEDKAFSTYDDLKQSPVSIYGSIANALANQFKDFDAFYFSAERKHSSSEKQFQQKKKIYFTLADRLRRKGSNVDLFELETPSSQEYLVTKVKPSAKSNLKNELKEALSQLSIFSSILP